MLGGFKGAWDVDQDDCGLCVLIEDGGFHSSIGGYIYMRQKRHINKTEKLHNKQVQLRWKQRRHTSVVRRKEK